MLLSAMALVMAASNSASRFAEKEGDAALRKATRTHTTPTAKQPRRPKLGRIITGANFSLCAVKRQPEISIQYSVFSIQLAVASGRLRAGSGQLAVVSCQRL